jgi:hypothetical protein
MKKAIIYQTADGIAVIHPAEGVAAEDCIKDVPEGAAHKIIDASELPADRYFRRAWKFADSGVQVDIETAKEVQRDKWRAMRAPKLAALDTDVMKAVERGDAKRRNALADQKQALRDVTETELPNDLDAIRNTIPEILMP